MSSKPITSDLTNSITKLDKCQDQDRSVVERFLKEKFGPQVISENGRDVLLWLIQVSEF